MDNSSFRTIFRTLTENDPFPWQEKLFRRLAAGDLPRHCDVPTGLGKTSVITVWLAALATSLLDPERRGRVPRRLVYIVDRRVVVDQATAEVERVLECLGSAAEVEGLAVLRPLVAALVNAGTVGGGCGVTVSTLRGKYADNHGWHLDPSRPAIVVGTVDMIGSRMLFAGYGGVGRNWRSLQAGLLLQDAWIVLDEAHLVPSFELLLRSVEHFAKSGVQLRPFGVTCMSATLVSAHTNDSPRIGFEEDTLFGSADMDDPRVAKRLNACKSLRFISVQTAVVASKSAERLAIMAKAMAHEAIALAEGKNAVVIFADTVSLVKAITVALDNGIANEWSNRVLTLTGEMRGAERDRLANDEILKAFSPTRERNRATMPAFLVATACVEVGMDFDADHAVCDAVALERMIQRLGRVNRRGEIKANIHLMLSAEVAAPPADTFADMAPADASVLMLRQLPSRNDIFDASPAALRALDLISALARRAFSPPPVSPPLDEPRLDDWSLTSVTPSEFPRPKVSYWLRGVTEDDSMNTSLVWRADLCFAASKEEASAMVDVIPVAPNEVAQIATHRAADLLSVLAENNGNSLLVIRSASGESRGAGMGEFADPRKRLGELASATVFLPSTLGGMLKAIPDSSVDALKQTVVDVVDERIWRRAVFIQRGAAIEVSLLMPNGEKNTLGTYQTEKRARNAVIAHLQSLNTGVLVRFESLVGALTATDNDDQDDASALEQNFGQAVAYFQLGADDNQGSDEDARSLAKQPVTLAEHARVAEAVARSLGARLGLPEDLCEAIACAARWHDRGKNRIWWQAAIGSAASEPLAKSGQPHFDHSLNAGYRHEFGSLIEARTDAALRNHPRRELILHLIAAHHGYARPSFPPEAYDRSVPTPECATIAAEVPRRFVELQQHFGWWTLAWLESLVKCADAIASTYPEWTSK